MIGHMSKNFHADTYIVDSYESFSYDAITQELVVHHANGMDQIRVGDYLNARYGILITAHNFSAT